MSLKLGTTDISGVPTTLINTVNGLASDMVGKADTDLSNVPSSVTNLPPTKLYNFDGQWVNSNSVVSTSTAIGTYTIDLYNYLPKDGYDYEVILCSSFGSTKTSPPRLKVYSDLLNVENNYIVVKSTSTSATFNDGLVINLPVKRYLYLKISDNSLASTSIEAIGYRRIGTNT